MMRALLLYTAWRYGSIGTGIIADMFKEEFSYMESCNMGLIIPDKHINKESISKGLFSPYINEGAIIK